MPSTLKIKYKKLPQKYVQLMKITSRMQDIVKASNHDFMAAPIMQDQFSLDIIDSKSGVANHESDLDAKNDDLLINTPIEAKSLDQSDRDIQRFQQHSPENIDMQILEQQEQNVFSVDTTINQSTEQKRYQSPKIFVRNNDFKQLTKDKIVEYEPVMNYDSPRAEKKDRLSINMPNPQKHSTQLKPQQTLNDIQFPSPSKTHFSQTVNQNIDSDQKTKKSISQTSSNIQVLGLNIELKDSKISNPRSQLFNSPDALKRKQSRTSSLLKKQINSDKKKKTDQLNMILAVERCKIIETLNDEKQFKRMQTFRELNKSEDKVQKRHSTVSPNRDSSFSLLAETLTQSPFRSSTMVPAKKLNLYENEDDDIVIVPLRQAKSHKDYDPLKSEEILAKYKKDNKIDCDSHDNNLFDHISLVDETEQAQIIESIHLNDIMLKRQIKDKLAKEILTSLQCIDNPKHFEKGRSTMDEYLAHINCKNSNDNSSSDESYDFSEDENDSQAYEKRRLQKKKNKKRLAEIQRIKKEHRQDNLVLIKNMQNGSFYKSLLKQRSREFIHSIIKFDASLSRSLAMGFNKNQKLNPIKKSEILGLSLLRSKFSEQDTKKLEISKKMTSEQDPTQVNNHIPMLKKSHTYLQLKDDSIDDFELDKIEDADANKDASPLGSDQIQLENDNKEPQGCDQLKLVEDLQDSKIEFETLRNLKLVRMQRGINEELIRENAHRSTIESQLQSKANVFDYNKKVKAEMQERLRPMEINDYRLENKNLQNILDRNQDKKVINETDVLGDEQFFANSSIIEQINELYFVHPHSMFSKIWQIVLLFALLYCATLMPYKVCFIEEHQTNWLVFDTIIDMIFITDILIVLNTPYMDYKKQKIIMSRRQIFMKYLKGWMLIDIASSIPLDLILYLLFGEMNENALSNDILKLLRVPRIYRVMRVARIYKVIKLFQNMPMIAQVKDYLNLKVGSQRLLEFGVTTFVMVHIISCFWYFIAAMEPPEVETWITAAGIQDKSYGEKYLTSMYWGYTTMLTVGYGDITPNTITEHIFAIIWMCLGAGIYTQVIGNLASVLATMDTKDSTIQDKISTIEEFCKEAKISSDLRYKLRDSIEYATGKNFFSWIDKQQILSELPANIRCEISMHMHEGIVKKINFFQDKDQTFIGVIVPLLQPCKAKKDDIVYQKGSHSSSIFFITKGRISFCLEEESDIGYLDMIMGSYFGEIEVINAIPRLFSVKASDHSDFLTLPKPIFELYLMNSYIDTFEEMQKVSVLRHEKISIAERFAMETVQKAQMQDIQNMTPDDFDRLIKSSTKIRDGALNSNSMSKRVPKNKQPHGHTHNHNHVVHRNKSKVLRKSVTIREKKLQNDQYSSSFSSDSSFESISSRYKEGECSSPSVSDCKSSNESFKQDKDNEHKVNKDHKDSKSDNSKAEIQTPISLRDSISRKLSKSISILISSKDKKISETKKEQKEERNSQIKVSNTFSPLLTKKDRKKTFVRTKSTSLIEKSKTLKLEVSPVQLIDQMKEISENKSDKASRSASKLDLKSPLVAEPTAKDSKKNFEKKKKLIKQLEYIKKKKKLQKNTLEDQVHVVAKTGSILKTSVQRQDQVNVQPVNQNITKLNKRLKELESIIESQQSDQRLTEEISSCKNCKGQKSHEGGRSPANMRKEIEARKHLQFKDSKIPGALIMTDSNIYARRSSQGLRGLQLSQNLDTQKGSPSFKRGGTHNDTIELGSGLFAGDSNSSFAGQTLQKNDLQQFNQDSSLGTSTLIIDSIQKKTDKIQSKMAQEISKNNEADSKLDDLLQKLRSKLN